MKSAIPNVIDLPPFGWYLGDDNTTHISVFASAAPAPTPLTMNDSELRSYIDRLHAEADDLADLAHRVRASEANLYRTRATELLREAAKLRTEVEGEYEQ